MLTLQERISKMTDPGFSFGNVNAGGNINVAGRDLTINDFPAHLNIDPEVIAQLDRGIKQKDSTLISGALNLLMKAGPSILTAVTTKVIFKLAGI
jgi:hypothetical protein